MAPEGEDHVKGEACLVCKRNSFGKKLQNLCPQTRISLGRGWDNGQEVRVRDVYTDASLTGVGHLEAGRQWLAPGDLYPGRADHGCRDRDGPPTRTGGGISGAYYL